MVLSSPVLMGLIAALSVFIGAAAGFTTGRYIKSRGLRYLGVFIAAIVAMIGCFIIGVIIPDLAGLPEVTLRAAGQAAWMGLFGCIFGALMAKSKRKKLRKSGQL